MTMNWFVPSAGPGDVQICRNLLIICPGHAVGIHKIPNHVAIHAEQVRIPNACLGRVIRKVRDELQLDQITPIRHDAYKFLKNCKIKFDIIFADPPYEFRGIESIPDLVFQNTLLKDNGLLIIEHSKRADLSKLSNYKETRNYGNVHFSFFKT